MEKKKLKEIRIEQGLKANYVAEAIGMKPATLSRKENGLRRFTITEAQALCKLYKVNMKDIAE